MTINDYLEKLKTTPETIEFSEIIEVIDANYNFTETAFQNGDLSNGAGENSGSCKLFSFAKLHGLDQQSTLASFGHYYREDVLQHPDGDDHKNIRNFIKSGWDGIHFESDALSLHI